MCADFTTASVVLVSMPWTIIRAPSIQLGLLKAVLDRAGIHTRTAHFYLDFFNMVARRLPGKRMSVDKFESFGEALGDWAFSVPPFRTPSAGDDEVFRALMARTKRTHFIHTALRVREMAPDFLRHCADEILALEPKIVGFTSTFQQNVASLALSKILKDARPDIRIVLGGANCEGTMGEALHRCFSWIDVVVRGEGERVAPRLFRQLLEGESITPQPGLCFRTADRTVVCEDTVIDDRRKRPDVVSITPPTRTGQRTDELGDCGPIPMDEIPLPVYDDYFTRLERSPLAEQNESIWLPYESARGCWWALKRVCTFCAANSQYLSFRSRNPDRVATDVVRLSDTYGSRRVWFVDNIMDQRYLRQLFPRLQERPVPMFVESRAHISRNELKTMRDAGVVMVQLGIESFSSQTLKLMDKGTTAIQNIRMIKWCAELGIHAFYNIIYGFPGESAEEYERMADAVLSLTHLEPPNPPLRLRLDRFSSYHRDPERFGIEVGEPYEIRRLTYDLPAGEIANIEYFFTFRYKDGRDPDSYVASFIRNCLQWRESWRRNFRSLSWHRTETGIKIRDARLNTPDGIFSLNEAQTSAYLACDAGATPKGAWNALSSAGQARWSIEDVAALLEEMTRRRLLFSEGGRYVSLAIEGKEEQPFHHLNPGRDTEILVLKTQPECDRNSRDCGQESVGLRRLAMGRG
jgi:ribosomal peptide maturation radical SAM protein 1